MGVIKKNAMLAAIIFVVSILYWAGLEKTPFHPDESTQIFMSSDFETFLKNPKELFWSDEKSSDLRQHYRELDAPITRTWIGLARWLAHQPELPQDWQWSKTWEENINNQAMPSQNLLFTARFSIAALFPVMLWLMASSGQKLLGRTGGWVVLILTASSALILLHTRRAMAEGWLVFTISLFIWSMVHRSNSPIWLGISSALAFCSKQSAAPLLLISVAALLVDRVLHKAKPSEYVQTGVRFLVSTAGVIFLLNPFLWAQPIKAMGSAINGRQDLLNRQTAMFRELNPDSVMDAPLERAAGLLANLFFTPPAIEEAANYIADLEPDRSEYLAKPMNNLFRGFQGGTLFFTLFTFGVALVTRRMQKSIHNPASMTWLWLIATFVLLSAGILWTAPLPFQRYVMPLVPFTLLFASTTLVWLTDTLLNSMQFNRRPKKRNQTKKGLNHPDSTL